MSLPTLNTQIYPVNKEHVYQYLREQMNLFPAFNLNILSLIDNKAISERMFMNYFLFMGVCFRNIEPREFNLSNTKFSHDIKQVILFQFLFLFLYKLPFPIIYYVKFWLNLNTFDDNYGLWVLYTC